MERLHKVLATAGICSRRAAERLMEQGRVQVNGHTVTQPGSRVDPSQDRIVVDGKPLPRASRQKIYLMLNKPRGCVTTLADPEGRPTVGDLIRSVRSRVFPVGRLDYDSEGLLLVTNDGDLARDLMHPGSGVEKTYTVKVRGRPGEQALQRLSRGVSLDGKMARSSRLRLVKGSGSSTNSWLEVTVKEGRKHLVRRMLQSIGHPVLKLRRTRYDGIRLGKLASGTFRPLTPRELAGLRQACDGAGGRRLRRAPRPT
jgi:23S rRNA pseudouridine2605 synthase